MNLIVISSPDQIENEATLINELFAKGLEVFHCRKPEWSKEQIYQFIKEIHIPYRDKIAIHQHHETAVDLGLTRLHFTEGHRQKTDRDQWTEYRKTGITLSTSIHQVSDYENIATSFDYVFYGPVFNSISKQGYVSVVLDGFMLSARDRKQAKRIALGGIDESNLSKALRYGFDGVAVLGTLWSQPEQAIQRFKSLKRITEEY